MCVAYRRWRDLSRWPRKARSSVGVARYGSFVSTDRLFPQYRKILMLSQLRHGGPEFTHAQAVPRAQNRAQE